MSDILALSAAFCIALSSMLIGELRGRIPLLVLARWQMLATFVMTGTVSLGLGGWHTIGPRQLGLLMLSGVVGMAIANTTYFATIYAIGPRLTALFLALAAPFALVFGYAFLGEAITPAQGGGAALVIGGVLLALTTSRSGAVATQTVATQAVPPGIPPDTRSPPSTGRPLSFRTGIALGLLTAVGQALGTLLARPAMASGAEPFTAMAIRSGVAITLFAASAALPGVSSRFAIEPRALATTVASSFFGSTLGMSLLMAALHTGDVGIVTTLSSMTPILILPMVWLRTGSPPSAYAWAGSLLAIAGIGVIAVG